MVKLMLTDWFSMFVYSRYRSLSPESSYLSSSRRRSPERSGYSGDDLETTGKSYNSDLLWYNASTDYHWYICIVSYPLEGLSFEILRVFVSCASQKNKHFVACSWEKNFISCSVLKIIFFKFMFLKFLTQFLSLGNKKECFLSC